MMKRALTLLALVFLFALAAGPLEATCWYEYDCNRCRSGGGGGPVPEPEPIPSLTLFLESLSEDAQTAAIPAPQQPCCVCCSPPGGPVNCSPVQWPKPQPEASGPEASAVDPA